jgi:4-hydroxyphenylpyruvate dioxygenase-like putative hemolysin
MFDGQLVDPIRPCTFRKIDHIAIAVRDLDSAVAFFTGTLGFKVIGRRRVAGTRTGMVAAELEHNGIMFVLCQGTEPESQVSRLIEHFGPGVAHIALAVDDVQSTARTLSDQGLAFDTGVIDGGGIKQVFSTRHMNSGLSFEFIERKGEEGFSDQNVNELFAQLERSGAF